MRFDLVRILLVDDNHHMRVLLSEILRAIGVRQVFEAASGAEALQVMRNEPIDIVMTDLAMQPLDGIEFVRLLRNSPDSPSPMAPVVMITGHSTIRRVAEARDVGVTEFLSKPVTARGVIERITRVIEHPRPFVRTADYFGPDRRRRSDPAHGGPWRRAADAAASSVEPERAALAGARARNDDAA
ncbi:MAG TPA: response regulator [Caulobacteraceae bacterium]|nr:response regulator [Caulobacteraceae bacterium]